MALGSTTCSSTTVQASTPSKEDDVLYSYAIGIPSRIDEEKLNSLKGIYQIPNDLNPRLGTPGECCYTPNLGVGIYEAYLLGGLRLPLNTFAKEILHRLGIGLNQLNPNVWRFIVSMQVLWREVFNGNHPLIVNEFLYCYKSSYISQSLGFY